MVGHPSSGGVTIKMPYGLEGGCFISISFTPPIFSYWIRFVKTECGLIVRSVEAGLGT